MPKYQQKFRQGDLIQVAEDLGQSMRHFGGKGQKAVVVGSYFDQFGGGQNEKKEFTLLFKNEGECSWYYEHQLTLIERGRYDLYDAWKQEDEEEE